MSICKFPKIIGIDFDNTLIDYSSLLYHYAITFKYINGSTIKIKNEIRNKIRMLNDGEDKWQKLQALIYGPKIHKAERFTGVLKFFRYCKEKKIIIYIISHKTTFAKKDETQTNLREAAINWMANNSFFQYVSKKNVFFETTREEKIKRIEQLGCDIFIDDLIEILNSETFPINTRKILFNPNNTKNINIKIEYARSWIEMCNLIFNYGSGQMN